MSCRVEQSPSLTLKMKGFVFILGCIALSTTATRIKLYKTERTEKTEVREFNMDGDAFGGIEIRKLRDDRGNLTNCGDKSKKFIVQWSPKILDTQDVVTIYWDIVAPVDFNSGNVHIDVYLPEIPQSPIFSLDQEVDCATIKKTVPLLSCPIKTGAGLKGQITISDLTRLPTGDYTVELRLTNENNLLFLCGRTDIELKA